MLFYVLVLLGLTVAVAPLASRLLERNAGWLLAIPLLAGAGMAAAAYSTDEVHTESVQWMPTIGVDFSLRLDGLSLVFDARAADRRGRAGVLNAVSPPQGHCFLLLYLWLRCLHGGRCHHR